MSKTMTTISEAAGHRVAIAFSMDNSQQVNFLTQEEFLTFMSQMFDYKDKHKEELQEVIRRMQQ